MKFSSVLLLFIIFIADLKAQKKDFRVYDAIMVNNKPDLSKFGMSYINMVYQESVVDVNLNMPNDMKLSLTKIEAIRKKIINKYPICLDIESWEINSDFYKISIPKYINTLDVFHKAFPNSQIAFFGVFPHDPYDLYKIISPKMKDKSKDWMAYWLNLNKKLQSIARKSDYITLVAYTPNDNREEWLFVLKQSVAQAKKLAPNKKLYVFLWPQYFNRAESYNEDYFHSDFWFYQLQKCYELADGIILWMPPYNNRKGGRIDLSWNDGDGWWIRTKEFINEHGILSNK
ncbi:hypothetical protein [Sphingobacterium sp. UBA2074]|uniref:hypothetical protein n=1 Tax=Sphingobacterium sp. UBA2074 TaxID=1947487 RepID=UPI00257C9CC8|nr:hypothetical protein [Sphingobacterium sp. UBA2074]